MAATTPISVPEELEREVALLATNYLYWAQRVARVIDKNTNRLIPLTLTPAQRLVGMVEARQLKARKRARIAVLKARQGGITTDQQARAVHLVTTRPHARAITVLHTKEIVQKVFDITHRIWQGWPEDMLFFRPMTTSARKYWLEFPMLDTEFSTATAGGRGAGRAVTLTRMHGSEFASWPEPRTSLTAFEPSLERDGTTIILETTAGAYGSEAWEFYRAAEDPVHPYEVIVIPWWLCEIGTEYRMALSPEEELAQALYPPLEPEEQALMASHRLTLAHIKWRRQQILSKGRSRFLQEYLEDKDTAWLVAGDHEYDIDMLQRVRADAESDPILHRSARLPDKRFGGEVRWFRDPRHTRGACVAGVDVAQGVGKDRSTVVVRQFTAKAEWELVCQYASSVVDPVDFAKVVYEIGRACDNAFLVIETNGSGATVLSEVRKGPDGQPGYRLDRIYHRIVGRSAGLTRTGKRRSRDAGWWTDEGSKSRLVDAFRLLLRAADDGEADPPTLETMGDAFALVRDERGKLELNGLDLLVAEALAWVGREYASSGPPKGLKW